MNRYMLKRVGWAFLTIGFVVVLNFFLFRILPGDPARSVKNPRLTAEGIEAVRVRFGLDKPIINCIESITPLEIGSCAVNPLDTQFFRYVINLLQGDLGTSFHTQRPVADMLAETLVNTLLLIGLGTILAIIFGVMAGMIAAWKSRTVIDYTALIGSLITWSLPTFWFGIILLFWGTSRFGLPIAGKFTMGASYDTIWDQWLDVAPPSDFADPDLHHYLCRGIYPLYAQRRAGHLFGRLYSDGQSQRAEHIPNSPGSCHAQCHAADGHHCRPESGPDRGRRHSNRGRVFMARPGPDHG